mmetsp:Transcript_3428/g.11255  ORF Transcript_3428/g.11255 Transcript_3428/m.11255 type:complete len:321 (-) Transcript_3428:441-1403(-)
MAPFATSSSTTSSTSRIVVFFLFEEDNKSFFLSSTTRTWRGRPPWRRALLWTSSRTSRATSRASASSSERKARAVASALVLQPGRFPECGASSSLRRPSQERSLAPRRRSATRLGRPSARLAAAWAKTSFRRPTLSSGRLTKDRRRATRKDLRAQGAAWRRTPFSRRARPRAFHGAKGQHRAVSWTICRWSTFWPERSPPCGRSTEPSLWAAVVVVVLRASCSGPSSSSPGPKPSSSEPWTTGQGPLLLFDDEREKCSCWRTSRERRSWSDAAATKKARTSVWTCVTPPGKRALTRVFGANLEKPESSSRTTATTRRPTT